MALEKNRCYGTQVCLIHTVKYEFAAILKNQETSHNKSLLLAFLEKNQRPSWQQWAEAESKLHLYGIHLDLGWGGLSSWPRSPLLTVVYF